MRIRTLAATATLALGLMAGGATDALAQSRGQIGGYTGGGTTAAPGCPSIAWSIHAVGNTPGSIAGVMWFTDMSGISAVRGTSTPDGKFNLTVASVSGAGPSGTVTGQRRQGGGVDAMLDGPGCSKLQLHSRPTDVLPGPG